VIENLAPNNLDHLKRLFGGNRVYKHIPMDADREARIEDAVFVLSHHQPTIHLPHHENSPYLTSGIDNLCGIVLALILDNGGKGILDSRIITLYKVSLDKLNSER
jgi:hypothetical protein